MTDAYEQNYFCPVGRHYWVGYVKAELQEPGYLPKACEYHEPQCTLDDNL